MLLGAVLHEYLNLALDSIYYHVKFYVCSIVQMPLELYEPPLHSPGITNRKDAATQSNVSTMVSP